MSRRQSLQLGALSMLGLLTTGGAKAADAASSSTATGNGATTGDGHKLVPDQGVRVTERPKDYITPKGLKVEREIVNISDLKFNLNGYDLGNRSCDVAEDGGGVNLFDSALAVVFHHSGIGTMITTPSVTIFRFSRARTLIRSLSSSTAARAA